MEVAFRLLKSMAKHHPQYHHILYVERDGEWWVFVQAGLKLATVLLEPDRGH